MFGCHGLLLSSLLALLVVGCWLSFVVVLCLCCVWFVCCSLLMIDVGFASLFMVGCRGCVLSILVYVCRLLFVFVIKVIAS